MPTFITYFLISLYLLNWFIILINAVYHYSIIYSSSGIISVCRKLLFSFNLCLLFLFFLVLQTQADSASLRPRPSSKEDSGKASRSPHASTVAKCSPSATVIRSPKKAAIGRPDRKSNLTKPTEASARRSSSFKSSVTQSNGPDSRAKRTKNPHTALEKNSCHASKLSSRPDCANRTTSNGSLNAGSHTSRSPRVSLSSRSSAIGSRLSSSSVGSKLLPSNGSTPRSISTCSDSLTSNSSQSSSRKSVAQSLSSSRKSVAKNYAHSPASVLRPKGKPSSNSPRECLGAPSLLEEYNNPEMRKSKNSVSQAFDYEKGGEKGVPQSVSPEIPSFCTQTVDKFVRGILCTDYQGSESQEKKDNFSDDEYYDSIGDCSSAPLPNEAHRATLDLPRWAQVPPPQSTERTASHLMVNVGSPFIRGPNPLRAVTLNPSLCPNSPSPLLDSLERQSPKKEVAPKARHNMDSSVDSL